MDHPNLVTFEKKLKTVLDKLDDALEDRYGSLFKLHPVRAARGQTSNKMYDGLFGVQANFSLGIGSQHGRGYIINIDLATLENTPRELITEIESFAINRLRDLLNREFPAKDLSVAMDGQTIKIFGDLHLGRAY
ncbi:hypothetical protein JW960_21885 [candidate division KSB1 bacterium]|nr:hypothetical protein [candidate division KSB1 bacterium]